MYPAFEVYVSFPAYCMWLKWHPSVKRVVNGLLLPVGIGKVENVITRVQTAINVKVRFNPTPREVDLVVTRQAHLKGVAVDW